MEIAAAEPPFRCWVASVAQVRDAVGLTGGLAREELAVADALRQPADRDRYRAARMLLRQALSGHEAGMPPPGDWRFAIGLHGKPFAAAGLPQIEFSISHAGDCVAVAISRGGPIGVDIETLAEGCEADIVADVLTEAELGRLQALAPKQRWAAFLRLWTLKEAGAKALGLGVSLPFREIEAATEPPRLSSAGPSRRCDLHAAVATVERGGSQYLLSVAINAGDAWVPEERAVAP